MKRYIYEILALIPTIILSIYLIILVFKFNTVKDENILLKKEIEFYKAKAEQGYLIDSLEFNIVKQDSIINETKKSYIYEIEVVEANNNIDAVAQFKELIGAE